MKKNLIPGQPNTRRNFVKNISVITAGLTLSPSFLLNEQSLVSPSRKMRVAVFGEGKLWTEFEQKVKGRIDMDCVYAEQVGTYSNQSLEYFENKLVELSKTQKPDGIVLCFEAGYWEEYAMRVLQSKLHLYVQAPLPKNVKRSKKLAAVPTGSIVHWQADFMAAHNEQFYSSLFSSCCLPDIMPPYQLEKAEGCVFNLEHSFHTLFHFGSGAKKLTWQWVKGEMALHLLDEDQKPGHTADEEEIILIHKNSWDTKGDIIAATKDGMHNLVTNEKVQHKTDSLKIWVDQIICSPSKNHCFNFSKMHQLTQILTLQKIVTNAFSHYKPGRRSLLRYPDDYLSLDWNADTLTFNKHTDLNAWI
jgi:hypothetical protein